MSRRTRQNLSAVTAVLLLAIWLTLTAAEGYEPLHAWLHGGKIPDNDACAIVMIHHGKMDTSVVVVNVSVTPALVVCKVLMPVPIFTSVDKLLLPGRGPPVLLSEFVSGLSHATFALVKRTFKRVEGNIHNVIGFSAARFIHR